MGKRVGRHRKEMAREMKRGGGMYGSKKKGKKKMTREQFIKRGEDALGDMPLP